MQLAHQFFNAKVIFLGLAFGSFSVFASLISLAMVGKFNEKVPEAERISYVWWDSSVRTKFKQLYPRSKLTFLLNLCRAMRVLCFLGILRFWVFS
jgi:hypothetical protein